MAYMIVDGHQVELEGEKNVLAVIRKAGIDLPTLCYYPDLTLYGACRMCIVENERGGIIAACSETPADGMVVNTNTKKLRKHRRLILELLLGSHCHDCTTCKRSEICLLQELAIRYGVNTIRFPDDKGPRRIDDSSRSISIDRNKCVLCGNCIRICAERQNVGAINFVKRGSAMSVSTAFDKPLGDTCCTGCGRCSATCPTGAIIVKDETEKAWQAVHDGNKRTAALVDPMIVEAIGVEFGLPSYDNAFGKIVNALRRIGFDEIYDNSFAISVARAAEVSAFLGFFDKKKKLPWFASWCPAWCKYVRDKHPELQAHLSTSTPPLAEMTAAVRPGGVDAPDDLYIVAFGPCTAIKRELVTGSGQGADLILTARALVHMIKSAGIELGKLTPETPDSPADALCGAGGTFDAISLSEAVTRSARGRAVRATTVYGLASAEEIIEQIEAGDIRYDYIEVLACPEGCKRGAGQPRAFVRQRALTDR